MVSHALAAKELPHPQLLALCGLFTSAKQFRIISSIHSSVLPRTRSSDTLSTTTRASPAEKMRSSSAGGTFSISNEYLKPEQPPPSTRTLKAKFTGSAPARLRSAESRRAAAGVITRSPDCWSGEEIFGGAVNVTGGSGDPLASVATPRRNTGHATAT